MKRKKKESEIASEKKAKTRMEKFNRKQNTKVQNNNIRIMKYWEKVEPGPWEEKEYIFKT